MTPHESKISNDLLHEITGLRDSFARVDERIKMVIEKLTQIDEQRRILSDLTNRISLIEAHKISSNDHVLTIQRKVEESTTILHQMNDRLTRLEGNGNHHQAIWKSIFDYIVRGTWVVFVAYVLYKLHLVPPPL